MDAPKSIGCYDHLDSGQQDELLLENEGHLPRTFKRNSYERAAYLIFPTHLPKQLSSSHCPSEMNSAQSVSCVAGIYLGE